MEKTDATDHRVRALAILDSLEKTLAEFEPYQPVVLDLVERYHLALEHLEAGGEQLGEFRLPESLVIRTKPGRIGTTPHVEREALLQRVREVRSYFLIRGSILERAAEIEEAPERLVGFEVPTRT